ncbi:hypothetical protein EHF33_02495 [Deinococcus psychrotolerans]|uniref:Zn-finger containing protein n=1 Tax=Deinococcus psychrotolerans TaxID=2489213 RepID=A0A3G8YC29_9DEIO|nr:hypothetical protein [Deinococcus psychrotolerans]AZI41757.1 hypothetical protein EHF33_02495 [Deinococcus psychrotolerans]
MRFPATCPHCRREMQAEYTDSGIHDLRCPHCGKPFTLYLRKHKFEMLFDLGTRALMDGYAREAVASFAGSLERFFEFYTRAATLERASGQGQDFAEAAARLEQAWKLVSAQSERQMGAFALAYLWREGAAPDFLSPQALGSDFRNKVIHRGYLPPRSEVDAYAARVFALIDRLLTQLGGAAAHAQLEQERTYAAHLAAQPSEVTAVFEEHPGMFRVRRFGGQVGPKTEQAKNLPSGPANDAAAFQAALRERGELLGKVFGKG